MMTVKAGVVGCITALLGAAFTAGCASPPPSREEATRLLNQIPDRTVTDPQTGCRHLKDDPEKTCLPNDFPKHDVK